MNCTGPMVSLIHGMPSWMPGGCTCMPDPVGMANMQYMGRIKLPQLEYLNVPIELDHWANWFFHIFMDTNKSVPHYGKGPSRLASAYAGTAVYDNWKFEDPNVARARRTISRQVLHGHSQVANLLEHFADKLS